MIFFVITTSLFFTGFSNPASLDQNTIKTSSMFHVLLWPDLTSTQEKWKETVADMLEKAWQKGQLLTYTNQKIKVIRFKDHSLRRYLRTIQTSEPECLEGNPGLIEHSINAEDKRYIPILEVQTTPNQNTTSLTGEIIFMENRNAWQGRLGVVHPDFDIGGEFQIQYWKMKTGETPEILTLFSPGEVLRHLFVGDSIQAAAIPSGSLEHFLTEHHRLDLIEKTNRFSIQEKGHPLRIYIRKDLYENPLRRTLIRETWLRDHCSDYVKLQFIH